MIQSVAFFCLTTFLSIQIGFGIKVGYIIINNIYLYFYFLSCSII